MEKTTEELMNHYQALKEAADNLKTQMDAIKIELGRNLPDGGTVAGHKVSWTKPKVNNTALAKDYTPETNPELYKPALDTKAVTKLLAPAVLDQYRTGQPTLTIR